MTDEPLQAAQDLVNGLLQDRARLQAKRSELAGKVELGLRLIKDLTAVEESLVFDATVKGDESAVAMRDKVSQELFAWRKGVGDCAVVIRQIDERVARIDECVADAKRQGLLDANAAGERRLRLMVPTVEEHMNGLADALAAVVAIRRDAYARTAEMGIPNRRLLVGGALATWLAGRLSRVLPGHFDRPRVKHFEGPLDVVLGVHAENEKGDVDDGMDTEVDGGRGREAGGDSDRDCGEVGARV